MVRVGAGPRRARHGGQHGFTLIEVIIAISVLTILSGALGGIFAVSYEMLRAGGPQTRLFGAHDLMILEQTLGQDGSRASCMRIGGTAYGSCGNGFSKVTCPATDLCIGWPQLSGPTCHVADYAAGSNTSATRTEYSVSSGGVVTNLGAVPLAREERVTFAIGAIATLSVTSTSPAYTWIRSVSITLTDAGPSSGASQSMVLHPVATDPAGPSANVTGGGSPC